MHIKALCFIETLVTPYRSSQNNISEDLNLQQRRLGNLEYRALVFRNVKDFFKVKYYHMFLH